MDFFRKHYKAIIWLMIFSFLLTLIPSIFFLFPGR
jgi:hypothetical protein